MDNYYFNKKRPVTEQAIEIALHNMVVFFGKEGSRVLRSKYEDTPEGILAAYDEANEIIFRELLTIS